LKEKAFDENATSFRQVISTHMMMNQVKTSMTDAKEIQYEAEFKDY
jgi:hypothetical protein